MPAVVSPVNTLLPLAAVALVTGRVDGQSVCREVCYLVSEKVIFIEGQAAH